MTTAMPSTPTPSLANLRAQIRQNTHTDEASCVEQLLAVSRLTLQQREEIVAHGRDLVKGCRCDADKAGTLDVFMQEFSLSSREGVALMCLAESLLRVPDAETADDLIAEKVLSGDWREHLGQSDSLFVNASTWGLMLTGQVVRLESDITEAPDSWIKKLVNRMGEPVVRTAVRQAMKIMGQQYVLGRDISEAIRRGRKENKPGTRFSFDMLGEGARTMDDADRYYQAYLNAIREIAAHQSSDTVIAANGISVKLSALHPRYEYMQHGRVMAEMLPRVRELALKAKTFNLGFSIDAEEADRLDISLDIFEALATDPQLAGWDGLGFVLQAYGKRASWVADWLVALATSCERRFMVRLVKGAYWDTEIKYAQEQGYTDYPVYTRKANTDLSYQVCAEKLLQAEAFIYPQFATHNAYTAALILALARRPEGGLKSFEFQRLHGMGDLLMRQLDGDPLAYSGADNVPVRVYAPVGAHKDLLPYLVRRLLENGANSSFVNRFMDNKVPLADVITDVQADVESIESRRHNAIPLPVNIFRAAGEERADTHGMDLANAEVVAQLQQQVAATAERQWAVGPIIGGVINTDEGQPVVCPADTRKVIGSCRQATAEEIGRALDVADRAQADWDQRGGEARAIILQRAADIMESRMAELVGLISYEAGRTLVDGVSEVREAVDFLRYYALQAADCFGLERDIIDPLGNSCRQRLSGRGVFFCISPWNFPLAIFTGQVSAALAAGNAVLTKPADPTPLIAAEAIRILHEAGVPGDVLNFLPARGSVLGPILNTDSRVKGVAFTGSTEVALNIQQTLVSREGIQQVADIPVFIAETGGQNSMVVDSSALPEQVVDDAIRSAFLSAGQRCSALRVMYIQEEVADTIITMLKGAMQELTLGMPWQADTDVGPVIDTAAQAGLLEHINNMQREATLHYACGVPQSCEQGTFVAPHLFELNSVNQLPGEIFGPILHVIRFRKGKLKQLIDEINNTGFGLTLGVHSRVEHFAEQVVKRTRVGNNYINRNMVGAVVGVNPFGGQGLSGTGPKAGGPNYMTRFAIETYAERRADSSDQQDINPQASVVDATTNKVIDKGQALSHGAIEALVKGQALSQAVVRESGSAGAIIGGKNVIAPGPVQFSAAYDLAERGQLRWDLLGGNSRGDTLDKAADGLERVAASVEKATLLKAAAAVCRYYAQQARLHCQQGLLLPGPTGETNRLSLHGRGIVYCAAATASVFTDFVGQLVAALAAGNAVIAEPANEQLEVSSQLVEILLEAGVPSDILHLLPSSERTVESSSQQWLRDFATADSRTAAVAWSGPLADALAMQLALVARGGAIVPVVLEKGGPGYLLRFAVEKTTTINIVATGGNALLLNLSDSDATATARTGSAKQRTAA